MAAEELAGSQSRGLWSSYDELVDVLYLVKEAVPSEGEGIARGVELDYSLSDGRPTAVTVIGYCRNGWNKELHALADIVAKHLSLDTKMVVRSILESIENEPTIH